MFSVRDILTAVFLALIAASMATAWLLADIYHQRDTDLLVGEIQHELSERINERIRDLLATPHKLNGMGESIIRGGQLRLDNTNDINQVFHGILPAHPHINALFFGGADGSMYGARWSSSAEQREVMEASSRTHGALNYYRSDAAGLPGELIESAPDYDPRERSWYRDAVSMNGPVWSPIYLDFATGASVMTAALPVYNEANELAGVIGCGIKFEEFDFFLHSLDIGKAGIAYVMERDTTLISASTDEPTHRLAGNQLERILATESPNTFIRESASLIRAHLEAFPDSSLPDDIRLTLDARAAYGSVFAISDDYGLDWIGVIVAPKSDYTAVISERNRVALASFTAIMLISLLAGLVSARVLTRPLAQLSTAAQNIANDVWDTPLTSNRQDEFGAVAKAFEHMRAQLHARIRDLRNTRNALRESEDHYARALEAAGVIAWSWEEHENAIKWTEQGVPLLGPTPGDHRVPVHAFLRRVHPDDRQIVSRAARQAIEQEEDYSLEYRIVLPNGQVRWVASRGKVVRDSSGFPSGMTGVMLDISHRKQLEAQLIESQKMEAVGRLAGGIAHDFNNLLQAILGFTDLARDSAGPNEAVIQELDEVIHAAERARELVSQLLAFSRRQVLDLGPISLDDVVHETGKMLSRLIHETIDLQIQVDTQNATIRADRGQVEQILVNLCVNARDAMPDGGSLNVTVSTVELGPDSSKTLPAARTGRFHRLRVQDSGIGMDEKTLRLMFEPFFTTKEVGKGTGLGLATVYGIVDQHRGFLHVTSTPGQGTTIDVYFEAENAFAEPRDKKAPPVVRSGGGTVLLAEDDAAVRTLARRILERSGYDVIEAVDGDAAIAAYQAHQGRIDVAFLDVVMPGKNGKTVLEVLRQDKPTLPVIFASGYAEGGVHTNFILDEGLTLIQKPYTSRKLVATLQALLDNNENASGFDQN